MTAEQDLVLIYYEDQPLSFARVEAISPDLKAGWYQVEMLLLQHPLEVVTWILRESYINGAEFTMGGHRMRMEKVVRPTATGQNIAPPGAPALLGTPDPAATGRVISLADRKKT